MAPGYHGDGGGLYLQVAPAGSKSWIFRFALAGRRREMGVGSFPSVSLAAAREAASKARALVKAGKDPIAVREAEKAQARLQSARGVTWDKAVDLFLKAHLSSWRNPKHRQQWRNTLDTYAKPVLVGLAVAEIGTPEVTKVLDSIWQEKPETASRVRGRIERILDWAKVRGYRAGENPARWRGHLDKVFPPRAKLRKVRHHAAVPIDKLPAVYAKLVKASGVAAKALRFTILTAVRPGETTGGTWPEVDRKAALWTIPAHRMKADKEHRVTLSKEAQAILEEMVELRTGQFMFPGHREKRPLSLTALSKALKAAGGGTATVHGMRSTFKDWASERTSFPSEVSEMALAHSIGDKVEAAYRRGELLEKRRAMMEQWATFVRTPQSGNVVSIGSRRA
ncbi:site-specific integrase [Reyranella sp.]|uniref:tyrosine-type recombinase/integrase n=1 Tax=Reyranella sp. TaxID=1929291 RepID=UPI00120D2DE8|nr:site-specific integrase [Reyranella sp.]TAJ83024.1 MAG: site-specific integrase [Reyranella sp.]